ncbi:MAG: hypothetical protein HY248_03395, partial [Fimbriimonas ginsengisoli]|nr:hypothetical protein [Fimbriimonas ginsengisoli]
GRARYTEDIDLWVRRTADNVERLRQALIDFGLPIKPDALRDFVEKDRQMIILGAAPQAADLLNFLGGVEFDDAWRRKIRSNFEGLDLDFLCREDFIASKRAAGRPKDLADLAALDDLDKRRGWRKNR